MNAQYPGPLYMTPVEYGSSLATAAFVERKEMLAAADKAGRLQGVVNGNSTGLCPPEGSPAPTKLVVTDETLLRGASLSLFPEVFVPDLSREPRRSYLNWDNAIRSIDVCAYPYSMYADINFQGDEYFINFRCSFTELGQWDLRISSLKNWGTLYPDV